MIGELEALVAEHPLRERLHAQRMLALYRSGRQSEALDAYRAGARRARRSRSAWSPGLSCSGSQQAILAHDPALDRRPRHAPPARPPPPQPAPARPPPRRRRTPLVAVAVLSAAAGLLAFGISRVTAPDRSSGSTRTAVGAIDPDGGRITAQYAGRPRPGGARGRRGLRLGRATRWTGPCRGSTVGHDPHQIVQIDVGGEPTALAFGAGSLWVANGESRSVAQVVCGNIPSSAAGPQGILASEGTGFWCYWLLDTPPRRVLRSAPKRPSRTIPGGDRRSRSGGQAGMSVHVNGTVARDEQQSCDLALS